MSTILLIITATAAALSAGVFFAWSCSVIPGLAQMADREYILAMQSFNKAILNPVFFAVFMGALVLLPVSTFMNYTNPTNLRFWLLLAATIVYAVGVFGVTAFGNVPLNESLAAFNLSAASASDIAAARINFEGPWVNLHTIRTVAAVVVVVLLVTACLSTDRSLVLNKFITQ
ncbi:hypothetical protein D3C80_1048840 [compost metagenome]